MILDRLGVPIAPILASASVVGIAVGFGAQNLVRDFLTGMFMIIEDQYGVGDVGDARPASGVVEAVGLRVTRLRDVNGVVWHIRNGEIGRVGNMTQGWSRVVIDVPIGLGTPVPRAREVIKAADAVWHDLELADAVLEEPEVWGVEALTTHGLLVRLVVKTAPLRQWDVARALRERIKAELDGAGIAIPSDQQIWLREGAAAGPPATAGSAGELGGAAAH